MSDRTLFELDAQNNFPELPRPSRRAITKDRVYPRLLSLSDQRTKTERLPNFLGRTCLIVRLSIIGHFAQMKDIALESWRVDEPSSTACLQLFVTFLDE